MKKSKLASKKTLLKKYRWSPIPLRVLRSKYLVPASEPLPGKKRGQPKRLSDGAKLLYAELLSWKFFKKNGTEGECRPHQEVLADDLDTSVDTIQRRLGELQRAGMIQVTLNRNAGKPSLIRFYRVLNHLCSAERVSNDVDNYRLVLDAARRKRLDRNKLREAEVVETVAPIIKISS